MRFFLLPRTFQLVTASQPVLLAVAGGTAVVYLAGAWWLAGRTYGCDVMGLRIIDRRGRAPAPGGGAAGGNLRGLPGRRALVRDDRFRRSLQDLLLGTYVVYDWMPTS